MKTSLLFLLTISMVYSAKGKSTQQTILKEIMGHVDGIRTEKAHNLWVIEAETPWQCTRMNLCTAAKALEKFTAENLGLQEAEWKLPRLLFAFTQLQHICPKPGDNATLVPLSQLLKAIHSCAKRQFSSLAS